MASPPAAKTLVVNIVSDTICPWCFVGKRRFEKAVAAMAGRGLSVQVRWRPFQLDPGLPAGGVDKMARYTEKFGAARVAQMLPMMAQVGAAEGISFDYGGRLSNTLTSHALLELAWQRGGAAQQDALVEALFKFYFEGQGDLGDAGALRGVCAGAGLAVDEGLEAVLAGRSPLCAEVAAEAEEWRARHGITGVTFFVLENAGGKRLQLSGAQEADIIAAALERLS